MTMKTTCIVCDKDVVFGWPGDKGMNYDVNCTGVASDATIWRSHGNYGSTEFDSMHGGHWLEVLVCDECLKKKARQVRAVESDRQKWVASFDDTYEALQAKREARHKEWEEQEARKLEMSRKVVRARFAELGSEEALLKAADEDNALGLRLRRMMNHLTAHGIKWGSA